jgi:hypothetical protein
LTVPAATLKIVALVRKGLRSVRRMRIERDRVEAPPYARHYDETLEADMLHGAMGERVIIRRGAGLELAAHSHEQKYVGVMLEDEFAFFDNAGEVRLRA